MMLTREKRIPGWLVLAVALLVVAGITAVIYCSLGR